MNALRLLTPASRMHLARRLASAGHGFEAKGKIMEPSFNGQNNFENFTENKRAEAAHHGATGEKWYKYSLFICVPALILVQISAWFGHIEEHNHPRPEFVQYPHLQIRTKEYPWGGNKSFFHNPETNALPDVGYEAPDPYLSHKH